MSDKKKIPTSVYSELTPNPDAIKFVADRPLISGGLQVEYRSKAEAMHSSPLAEELFNFPFVNQVFISGNYVTVAKNNSIEWDLIVMQLREYIREWLMNNEVAVTSVPAELMKREPEVRGTAKPVADFSAFEPSEHDEAIRQLLNDFVRPAVEMDGGAIDFVAYKDKKVYVHLRGSCSGCPSSTATLKGGIENLLRAKMPEVVEEVVAESV